MSTISLQIDSLDDAILPEYMMASAYSLGESQILKQTPQIVKSDVGIRATAENPLQKLVVSAHCVLCLNLLAGQMGGN